MSCALGADQMGELLVCAFHHRLRQSPNDPVSRTSAIAIFIHLYKLSLSHIVIICHCLRLLSYTLPHSLKMKDYNKIVGRGATMITEFLVAAACLKLDFRTILRLCSQGRRKGDPNINVVGNVVINVQQIFNIE